MSASIPRPFPGSDPPQRTGRHPDPADSSMRASSGDRSDQPPSWDEESDAQVVTREKTRLARPRLYKVLLHNDDYTTTDFVVDVLVRHFNKAPMEATRIMLEVHYGGVGTAGVYPKEIAETKVDQVTREAEQQDMPLLVTIEPE